MNNQEKKAQIRRIFDLFNTRDFDGLDEIFHPEYVDHTPMGELRGPEALKGFLRSWLAAFPDARFEVSNIVVEGDQAAWQVRFTATNTGSMMGMPPTGKAVDVLGIHMGRLADNGQPIEHWTGNDLLVMMQQLGLVPQMGAAPTA